MVERFIEALDLSGLTLLVHDSSGPIGLHVAGKKSDRFAGLILTDCLGWPLTDYPKVRRMLRFVSGPLFGFLNNSFNLLPWVVANLAPRRRKLSRAERQAYVNAFPTRESRRQILSLFRDLVTQHEFLQAVEQGLLHLKHLPVLLMYGEHDPARLAGFQTRFEELLPRHHSVVIQGKGHFPHEGAPGDMVRAIREWSAHELQDTRPGRIA